MKVAIMATANEDHFKSRRTKYLAQIIDKPLIAYAVEQAKKFSPDIVAVAKPNEELRQIVEALGAQFVEEAAAVEFFAALNDEPVLVLQGDDISLLDSHLSGDETFSASEVVARMLRLHKASDAPATYISLSDAGFFHFTLKPDQVDPDPRHSVPYIVEARHFAPLAQVLQSHPDAEPYPVAYYTQVRVLANIDISRAISTVTEAGYFRLSQAGANVFSSAIIGSDVTAEPDVVIYPNVEITGKTHIGAGTVIRSGSRLHNMTVGANCEIEQSVLLDSTIGNDTTIGPFAFVRPGSNIGSHCRIGDFVEVKNSTIGDNSKASHLGYIGDSLIGKNVNFGCGCITVNYDGANKNTTVIEDGAFVGSNCNLVAPVRIGEGSFVAAGSTITHNVPPGEFAVARQRQQNKPGWKRPVKSK